MAGQLHVAFVRSTEAHARIVSIDASAALEREDVEAVFTGEDITDMAAPCVFFWKPPGVDVRVPDHWPLARDKVGYVGQCVAAVIGRDKYSVVDAAEHVVVEYDPLPVVVDPEAALEDASPTVHDDYDTNACSSGASAAATSTRASRTPTSSSSGGSSTTARPAPRSSRSGCSPPGRPIAHAVLLDADPAHRARRAVDPARHQRGPHPRGRAGGGRRLRVEAAGLRRGGLRLLRLAQAEPARQVGGHALRGHVDDAPRARQHHLRASSAPSATGR